MSGMSRREFVTLLGGAAVAWPRVALTQQVTKLVRIGFLTLASGPTPSINGFQQGLRQLGYVEGRNLVLIYRWAPGQNDRLVELAKELLDLQVDVFASNSTEAIIAIRSFDKIVPVVMVAISDPIGNGLVSNFARPGGNTTGVTLFSTELAAKRGCSCSRRLFPGLLAWGSSQSATILRPLV
jgi:putative ABC transport system substrate-binding protein